MADKDKFLATFRINQDEWKDFMAQAKAEGSSASAVLVDFIQWYRAGNRIAGDTKSSTHLDNLEHIIDERILAKLNELEPRDSQPHLDNLDTILDERDRYYALIDAFPIHKIIGAMGDRSPSMAALHSQPFILSLSCQ